MDAFEIKDYWTVFFCFYVDKIEDVFLYLLFFIGIEIGDEILCVFDVLLFDVEKQSAAAGAACKNLIRTVIVEFGAADALVGHVVQFFLFLELSWV